MRSSISYEDLTITPFKLISILDLNIEKKINEHGRLFLKGVIPEENKDTYINSIDTQVDIKDKESGKTIFRGRIVEIKVNLVRGVHYIEVEAFSNTYEYDLRIKKRSFQNMNLNSIVKSVISGYNGDFITTVNGDKLFDENENVKLKDLEVEQGLVKRTSGVEFKKIKEAANRTVEEFPDMPTESVGRMIAFGESADEEAEESKGKVLRSSGTVEKKVGMSNRVLNEIDSNVMHTILLQYNETDWEFLIRIASRLGVGLVSDCTSEKARFWIGVPKGKNLGSIDKFTYSVCKEIDRFKYISRNSTKDHLEKDFINYEIETGEVFSIGDALTFEEQNLSIIAVESIFKDGVLKSFYKLSSREGAAQRTIYNKDIIGLSLEGKVTAVSGDKLKVHLKIDGSAGSYQFAYSSPYTAEGSGGWYAMPEVGDTVYVYFPDDREENAFSTLSLRKDGGGLGDPSTKYFKTKSGKELIFSPSEIIITTGDTLIKLSDGSGVEISTPKNVNINAGGDMNISAASKLILSADGKLQMSCNASLIKMSGDIVISGNDVKLN